MRVPIRSGTAGRVLGAGPLGPVRIFGDGGGGVAAIDVDRLADDEIGIVRGEEDRGADEVLRATETAQGDAASALGRLFGQIVPAFHASVGKGVHVHAIV